MKSRPASWPYALMQISLWGLSAGASYPEYAPEDVAGSPADTIREADPDRFIIYESLPAAGWRT